MYCVCAGSLGGKLGVSGERHREPTVAAAKKLISPMSFRRQSQSRKIMPDSTKRIYSTLVVQDTEMLQVNGAKSRNSLWLVRRVFFVINIQAAIFSLHEENHDTKHKRDNQDVQRRMEYSLLVI
jgi:hypothetical protein